MDKHISGIARVLIQNVPENCGYFCRANTTSDSLVFESMKLSGIPQVVGPSWPKLKSGKVERIFELATVSKSVYQFSLLADTGRRLGGMLIGLFHRH